MTRLRDLTADVVADHLVEGVAQHISRLAFGIGESYRVTIDRIGFKAKDGTLSHDPLSSCTLGATAVDLLAWTTRGELGDWHEPDGPLDAIQTIVTAYYGAPGIVEADLGTPEGQAPTTPVGILVTAAMGRVSLCQGQSIRPAQLAALASVTVAQVRNEYAPDGPLDRAGHGQITCDSAVAWLSGRGVKIDRK